MKKAQIPLEETKIKMSLTRRGKKHYFIFIFIFLLVSAPIISSEVFGFDNENLPKLVQELFGGKPSSFFMPNNKSVFGNFSFDGTCLNGGVEIKQGTICAQILQVFNITNVNVTRQSLTITDNLTVLGNLTADNFIGTHIGNSSIWSRAGSNTFLTNSGDNVGIGTSNPQNPLNVVGDLNVTGDFIIGGNITYTAPTGSDFLCVERVGSICTRAYNATCQFVFSPGGTTVLEVCD